MFADIVTGKTAGADVVFLIALILAGLATIIYLLERAFAAAAVAAAVGLVAFGVLLW